MLYIVVVLVVVDLKHREIREHQVDCIRIYLLAYKSIMTTTVTRRTRTMLRLYMSHILLLFLLPSYDTYGVKGELLMRVEKLT